MGRPSLRPRGAPIRSDAMVERGCIVARFFFVNCVLGGSRGTLLWLKRRVCDCEQRLERGAAAAGEGIPRALLRMQLRGPLERGGRERSMRFETCWGLS